MTASESKQAAIDVNARALLPIHIGRFALARHPWKEPFEEIQALSENEPYQLQTPLIGQPINLASPPASKPWWQSID